MTLHKQLQNICPIPPTLSIFTLLLLPSFSCPYWRSATDKGGSALALGVLSATDVYKRQKLTIYLLFLRAILTYAAPAFWVLLSPSVVACLKVFQSRTLLYISNSPWFVRHDAIRRGLKVPSLTEFVRSLALKLFTPGYVSIHPHIRRLSTDVGPPPRRHKRPRALLDDPP